MTPIDALLERLASPMDAVFKAAWRFWWKVDKTEGCWFWNASKTQNGYGRFSLAGAKNIVLAHRYSWELAHQKKIPEGMQIDHLCRVRHCVNPAHLDVVTNRENILRGVATKTHCKRGHLVNEANFVTCKSNNRTYRTCRICRRLGWHRIKGRVNAARRKGKRHADRALKGGRDGE